MTFAFKSHITEWRLVILQAQEIQREILPMVHDHFSVPTINLLCFCIIYLDYVFAWKTINIHNETFNDAITF
ncbi:hypothetical protein CY35_10G094300 [Sphagnum magellanicum]|nr:hypothetical protein CY35_10G094300 [Sphagnum magellanicum]